MHPPFWCTYVQNLLWKDELGHYILATLYLHMLKAWIRRLRIDTLGNLLNKWDLPIFKPILWAIQGERFEGVPPLEDCNLVISRYTSGTT